MNKNIFTNGWEKSLDTQLLKYDRSKRRAYVCSPLGAETDSEFLNNMRNARAYMFYAHKVMHLYARAPHAYMPLLLCDRIPAERAMGLHFGLELLENSEVMLVCGNRISAGMAGEIKRAASLNIEIIVFNHDIYYDVKKLVSQAGGSKYNVKFGQDDEFMATHPDFLHSEDGDIT